MRKLFSYRWFFLPVILILTLILVGCSYDSPATQDIVTKSQAAGDVLNSYQFDFNLDMALTVTGNTSADSKVLSASSSGSSALDVQNKNSHLLMNIDAGLPDQGRMQIPLEYYVTGGWMYVRISIPLVGEHWYKMPAAEPQWESQQPVSQLLDFLKNAVTVNQTGTEKVNDMDCFVLSFNPDLKQISAWLTSLAGSLDLPEQSPLPSPAPDIDLSKFIRQLSIQEWIAKDTYLIAQAKINMDISVNAADLQDYLPLFAGAQADLSASETDFSGLTLNLAASMSYHDYNQPVTITLPAAAQNAEEIGGSGK
jgi:hypothetical protein